MISTILIKKSRRETLLLFLFLITTPYCFAQSERIDVGLLSGKKITRLLVAPVSDVYSVFAGDSLLTLIKRNDALSLTLINDSVEVKTIAQTFGVFKSVQLIALVKHASLKIKPADGKTETHLDNDLFINPGNNSLTIINHVDLDNYVAGVVEAESGYSVSDEYYKIQAIMCRTFAIESRGKHKAEGYDLCDREHCQVFKGRNNRKPEIKLAVAATSGIVLVDSTNKPIFAAYHSNCGGQTDYSENVWRTEKSYLKPVVDSFCISSRNANWEKVISLHDWEKYLVKQNKEYIKPVDSLYCFYQPERKSDFELFGTKIPLTQVRKDFKLSSTFFHIEQNSDNIIFTGRGSGHGVGLCQQGAIEMARRGYSYKKILGYYYKGVRLVEYTKVK
jgi:stage II sporulation protein D